MNLKQQKIFCKPDMKNVSRALRFAGWYAIVPIMYAPLSPQLRPRLIGGPTHSGFKQGAKTFVDPARVNYLLCFLYLSYDKHHANCYTRSSI